MPIGSFCVGAGRRFASGVVPACALLLLLNAFAPAASLHAADEPHAQSTSPQIVGIDVGFAGSYKVGCWTWLVVHLQGGSATAPFRLEVETLDGDGVATVIGSANDRMDFLPRNFALSVPRLFRTGPFGAPLTVRLLGPDQLIATRTWTADDPALAGALSSERELIVMVGETPPAADAAKQPNASNSATNATAPVFARVASFDQLPTVWYAYEAADSVVLHTSRPEMYFAESEKFWGHLHRIDALEKAVQQGMKLVLCAGKHAPEVLAAGAPLARFSPGRFAGMTPLRQTSAIEGFAETDVRLDLAQNDVARNFRLEVPKLEAVRGKIIAHAGSDPTELPLVIRTPCAFGEVVFAGVDLDVPPLSLWSARDRLITRLLDHGAPKRTEQTAIVGGRVGTIGYEDLAGQLRAALDQFDGVRAVPFWFVALLLVAYVLLIGPSDYFLVSRVLKRPQLTWLTSFVVIALFCGGAATLARSWKGADVGISQVDVVDFDQESSQLRGTTWTTLFSPASETYNLSLAPHVGGPASAAQVDYFTWQGLPGTGYGGLGAPGAMSAAAAPVSSFSGTYRYAHAAAELREVPIPIWSSKPLIARWTAANQQAADAQLVDQGDEHLAGTLTSRLEQPLEDCVLFYGRWVYRLGKLAPGDTIELSSVASPQTADTYLREQRGREESERRSWDQQQLDVPRIARMILFYELAGGKRYVSLSNRFQREMDLSEQVRLGRAVLFGRSDVAASELRRDGQPLAGPNDRHWTFHRWVLPVRHEVSVPASAARATDEPKESAP